LSNNDPSVVNVIELVGCSSDSMQNAVEVAVAEAVTTVRNLKGFDVVGWTGKIRDGKIIEYRANVKLSFLVEAKRK